MEFTVKGGKYLEAVAEADTIVFDKTGTLTKAKPTVKESFVFGDYPEPELCGLLPVWKNTFHIPWQKLSWMLQREEVCIMKKCIQKWSIL